MVPVPCAPGSNANVLALGYSVRVTYNTANEAVACVDLTAGQAVDLGLAAAGGLFGVMSLTSDAAPDRPALTLTPLPNRVWSDSGDLRTIYPAVVPPASGRYYLHFHSTGCGSGCFAHGDATIHARLSAPILLAQFRGNVGFNETFQFRRELGAAGADEILLRNAGSGSVSVVATSRRGLAVGPSSAVTVAGPSSGWSASEGAVSIDVQMSGINTTGFHSDTLNLSGIPDDRWNKVSFREIPVHIRVHEAGQVTLTPRLSLNQLGIGPGGDLFVAGFGARDTIFRVLRPSGDLAMWRQVSPAPCCFDRTLQYVGGMMYFTGSFFEAVYRAAETGPTELVLGNTSSSRAFVVLPDASIYDFSDGLRRRSPTGEVQTVFAGGVASGIAFSASDSVIYYGGPTAISKLNLATQARTGVMSGLELFSLFVVATDKYGRLYAIDDSFGVPRPDLTLDKSLGNSIVVMNSSGQILDRRWPAFRAASIVIARDSIFGLDNRSGGAIWILPVKPPSP